MRDLVPTLEAWTRESRRFALATVVGTGGSAPRGVGAAMAVREDGLIAGSVSGGCVEGAVVAAAMRALESGRGEMLAFGPLSDAALFEVGLTCGGTIEVWVQPIDLADADWLAFLEAVSSREPVVLASSLRAEDPGLASCSANRKSGAPWLVGTEQTLSSGASVREDDVFLNVVPPRERLLIVGAVHIATCLVPLAKTLGIETYVIDPREAFARLERFPTPPDHLIANWPVEAFAKIGLDAQTAVVMLAHDSKLDEPGIAAALTSPAFYVGALGSRSTQTKRREALAELGLTPNAIERLHGPIGIDIGAKSPEEIAVSVLAEIVQVRRQGTAR